MNPIHRAAALLAGLSAALLACSASPAALAAPTSIGPVGGSPAGRSPAFLGPNRAGYPAAPVPIHTITMGGMPGWQITLIAAVAAIFAAAAAVILDRARTSRQHFTTPST